MTRSTRSAAAKVEGKLRQKALEKVGSDSDDDIEMVPGLRLTRTTKKEDEIERKSQQTSMVQKLLNRKRMEKERLRVLQEEHELEKEKAKNEYETLQTQLQNEKRKEQLRQENKGEKHETDFKFRSFRSRASASTPKNFMTFSSSEVSDPSIQPLHEILEQCSSDKDMAMFLESQMIALYCIERSTGSSDLCKFLFDIMTNHHDDYIASFAQSNLCQILQGNKEEELATWNAFVDDVEPNLVFLDSNDVLLFAAPKLSYAWHPSAADILSAITCLGFDSTISKVEAEDGKVDTPTRKGRSKKIITQPSAIKFKLLLRVLCLCSSQIVENVDIPEFAQLLVALLVVSCDHEMTDTVLSTQSAVNALLYSMSAERWGTAGPELVRLVSDELNTVCESCSNETVNPNQGNFLRGKPCALAAATYFAETLPNSFRGFHVTSALCANAARSYLADFEAISPQRAAIDMLPFAIFKGLTENMLKNKVDARKSGSGTDGEEIERWEVVIRFIDVALDTSIQLAGTKLDFKHRESVPPEYIDSEDSQFRRNTWRSTRAKVIQDSLRNLQNNIDTQYNLSYTRFIDYVLNMKNSFVSLANSLAVDDEPVTLDSFFGKSHTPTSSTSDKAE